MPNSPVQELQSVVERLYTERQQHADAIAQIDDVFSRLGIAPETRRRGRPGRPKGGVARSTGKVERSTWRRFGVPGPESILQFVRQAGSKGVTGADIDKNWKRQGRAGSAYNILGQLIEARRLKREKVRGGRGSVYTAA